MLMWKVRWDKAVQKQLFKLPDHIVGSFYDWAKAVETDGMEEVRKLAGYHDEKLHGEMQGMRSVRISKAYRVFYYEARDGTIKVAQVTKVIKHEYKK
jgi:proteic killer suppression protein